MAGTRLTKLSTMTEEKEKLGIFIPFEVLKANFDRRGYFARHRHHYQAFRGDRGAGKLAWEAVEAELVAHGLPGRYSSYEAFLVHRGNWIKKFR